MLQGTDTICSKVVLQASVCVCFQPGVRMAKRKWIGTFSVRCLVVLPLLHSGANFKDLGHNPCGVTKMRRRVEPSESVPLPLTLSLLVFAF